MSKIKWKNFGIKFYLFNLTLLFIILLILSGCAHLPKNDSTPHWKKIGEFPYLSQNKVHRYSFANGLKLLVLEDHAAPVFAYQTWFNVGSKDERPGLTGLAHLFEHMMFKATKNYAEGYFDKTLEQAGAEMTNAFTSRDYTAYVLSLPKNQLELTASLEADRMVNLLVNDDSLNKEREVVQNERRMRNENSPDGKLQELIYSLAYQKHSYRWPVIGYPEDLERAKSKQCYDFYKLHYAPNAATIIVVGDVNPDEVADTVQKYYGAILPNQNTTKIPPEKEPVQSAEHIKTVRQKIEVQKLLVGYHVPAIDHPDIVPLGVLQTVLAGGKSSRLYRSLVDSGIASSVSLSDSASKDPGLTYFFITMQKGKPAKQALRVLDKEIEKIQNSLVTQNEISRAVTMARFDLIDQQASLYYRALFLGFYETVAGNYEHGLNIVNAYKKVTPEEVRAMAKKYLKSTNRSVLIGEPQ